MYEIERLPIKERLGRLEAEFSYCIKSVYYYCKCYMFTYSRERKKKLNTLNNKFGILSAQKTSKTMSQSIATSLVVAQLGRDVHSQNGPEAIKRFLAICGISIPRRMIRIAAREHDPFEYNCDGHEKLSSKALHMGPVGIPIYEFCDKVSGHIILLTVVPDDRSSVIIGHLHLDLIEKNQAIPLQITVDKGSETGEMYAQQIALRELYAPDLSLEQWPTFVALMSTHNTNAEGLWLLMSKMATGSIREIIQARQTFGYFIPTSQLHMNLFQWLWPRIVQHHLDEFTLYWNTHRVRSQHKKALPSGTMPNNIFFNPAAFDLENVAVPVLQEAVNALRACLPLLCNEALKWVEPEFDQAAELAFSLIGWPSLEVKQGWVIFGEMIPHLQELVF
ncbi:hypothetical protein EDD85DRAFT_797448 [Armillaria nabsnona]|nr:hypothetical protein EDD85DRAFT_797448 [Armillaria nabsnona]